MERATTYSPTAGGVFAFGDAPVPRIRWEAPRSTRPIVGGAITPDGKGYHLFAADGGVFSFGDARYFGSMGGAVLNKPVVGGAATPSGGGYYLVAADGGVFLPSVIQSTRDQWAAPT